MERPREVAEAERKSQHREVALRARVTQPDCRLGKEAVQLRGKLRVARVEVLSQLQQQAVRGLGGKRHCRSRGRIAGKISARFCRRQRQSVGAGQGVQLRSGRGRNAHTGSSNRQKVVLSILPSADALFPAVAFRCDTPPPGTARSPDAYWLLSEPQAS